MNSKIEMLHNEIKIKYGSMKDELPEQQMVVRYLTGKKVLEIGGNIGRNSLIIGKILKSKNNSNMVTLESDEIIAKQLLENRNINELNFFIEDSALSKKKLIQRGWNTIVSDKLLNRYKILKQYHYMN